MSSTENPAPQQNANFRAQNLNGALWDSRAFTDGDFSQVQANESRFHQISFDSSVFHAAIVRNAEWKQSQFASCAGRFMEMENTRLDGSQFKDCRFEDSSFYDVSFENSKWTDSIANGCDFRYSSFRNADLQNVNLSNCDLAHVDFTGCRFENVNAYNARITNAIGLSDAQRDQLLAGGAYEGLPPAINKLRKRSLSLQRDFQSRLAGLREKVKPTTWIDTQGIIQKTQETFQEWREERKRQQEELQRQEDEWRKEQETRRLKSIEDRKLREERRRQEKEAQQAERERLQERRIQEQEIQDLLQAQQSERKQLQDEIEQFFQNLEERETEPKHIEIIGDQANTLYQNTEESLNLEQSLRQQLQLSPLDDALQQQLDQQVKRTQQLASEALNVQQRYFKAVQEWKREENALLKKLQQEALTRSTQMLLENRSQFTVDSDAFKKQILTIETQSHRDLLRAQLEHEQNAIRLEKEELENAVSLDQSETEDVQTVESLTETDAKPKDSVSIEDVIDLVRSIEDRSRKVVAESDFISSSAPEIDEEDTVDDTTAPQPQETAEYKNLFSKVAEWFTVINQNDNPDEIQNNIQDEVEFSEEESEPKEIIDTLDSSEDAVEIKFNQRIEEQYEQELTRIEEQIGSETLHPDLLNSLKEIQQSSVQEILKANNDATFLSEEAIQNLQSDVITTSLLSFREQLERERALAEQKVELERQQDLKRQLLENERELAKKRQQELEEQKRLDRERLAEQRQSELEAQHKKQLQSIIESRYAKFEQSIVKSPEEEAESFNSIEDLEAATTNLQKLQGFSFNKTLQTFIESEAQKQREELEAKRQQEERQRQREFEAQVAAQKQAEREEERKRKEAHRAALKKQTEVAKSAAQAAEIERRERIASEKAAERAAALARKEQIAKEKADARAAQAEQRKQLAREKAVERAAALARKEQIAKEMSETRAFEREELAKEKAASRAIELAAKAVKQEELAREKAEKQRILEEKKQSVAAEKERKKQERLEQKRIDEEQKRREEERRRQERELKRLEALENEQRASIERKRERLSLLKDQLLEEARRQEYQELAAQIEADIEVQQSQSLERQRKQEMFLTQVRAEQKRRANDPLLLEQERQQELLLRKQERLQRLQEREREIQNALLQLQTEYESEKISAPTKDLSIQIQSPMQQRWYRFTDIVSSQSPPLAQSLDTFKEQLEELYISRQAQARFSREQQKKVAASALEEKRRLEHQGRLKRLAEIRSREEQREARLLDEAEQRARKEAKAERQERLLTMDHSERHQLHRIAALSPVKTLTLVDQDLRGETHPAAEWMKANAQRCLLSGTRLEAANLIEADLSLALLDYANLKGATLDRATLHKSNLEGANLQYASLQNSTLRLTRIYDADLRQIDAAGAVFNAVDCTGSKAVQSNFSKAVLTRCTFVEMNFKEANFSGADITGSVFNRTDLTDVQFTDVNAKDADFRGSRGLTKETLNYLAERGAIIDLNDAVDRYGTWGAPQLRVAIVLFALGVGSLVLTNVLDGQQSDLETLEAEAQALRNEDAGLASERYEALAISSQILDEQVQYYIESAILAEQNSDLERSEQLFSTALVAADLNTELNTKVGLRFAQFLLTHSKPQPALDQLQKLMTYQSLSTFQRAKLIFFTEQACEILGEDASKELENFYASMTSLPEVEADLHMALSDLRLQHGQSEAALAELRKAQGLDISDGLALRLIESTARAHDRLGNLPEAIAAYEELLSKAEPQGQTAQTATLAIADLWRREGNTKTAMSLLETLTESANNDGRLRSRTLLVQGRLLEEEDKITEAADKYKAVLSIADVEPETLEESRVSLARLLLQNDSESVGDLPPEILAQAKLGEARTTLDKGDFEEALDVYTNVVQTENLTDNIRRAAQSGMAEALSNLGKHSQANDIWEALLREKIDPVESQHIEVLLAYSKLQANDLEGARLAFESLEQSNDTLIRYQGLLGSAQTSVLSGELERAKSAYERILQSQPSEEIQIQVWQELAQIAQEQNAVEDVLLAWQNILRFGVDDEALRAEAHTSIARTLAQMDRLDEAIAECELNLSTPEAQLQCAMILEMAGDNRALERYEVLANNERVTDALRSEAALGAAKLSPLNKRPRLCLLGLSLSQIDPTIELQLIQLYLETRDVSEQSRQEWQTRQTELAEGSPQILVQYLMERTSQLRAEQKLLEAIQTMAQGITGLPDNYGIPLKLELADMRLEFNDADGAVAAYQELLSTEADQRLVRSGLARAQMIQENWTSARETLTVVDIKAVTGTEIHMLMEINQHDPTADGLELASRWATQASNPDVQWEALMTQGHESLGEDSNERALTLFEDALKVAVEPRQQFWAQLGKAEVYRTMEKGDEALAVLKGVQSSEDAEVLGQCHIQMAQTLLSMDRPEDALESLQGYTAKELGPGWDMTVEELRAQINGHLNEFDAAYQILSDIETRWPDEEQVLIPSAIVKIRLLQQEGELGAAQAIAQSSLDIVEDPVYRSQIDDLLTAMQ